MADHADVMKALIAAFPGRLMTGDAVAPYATDSSVFSLTPLAALPVRNESEVQSLLTVARESRIPVVARAGGSNTGGAAVTDGLLLLFADEWPEDSRVDESSARLTCGPGVRHDRAQEALLRIGHWLPSDPSSGPLSYIGGNVATRASGPHALRYGGIDRYVRHVRFITSDGSIVDTRESDRIPAHLTARLGDLARRLALDTDSVAHLQARRGMKWASGYDLAALLDHADDPPAALPRLLTGSVGTLGIVTEVELQGVPAPSQRAALLLRFSTSADACAAAAGLRERAVAVEIVNRSALEILREHTDALGADGTSEAMLIVEYSGPDARALAAEAASATSLRYPLSGRPEVSDEPATIDRIWRARKALLPVIRRLTGSSLVAYSIVNDVGVHPDRLGALLAGAEEVFTRRRITAPIYGHAGSGNLHLRPLFPRGDHDLVAAVAEEIYTLVTSLGGTITAEHGMGRLRAPFLQLEWGSTIVGYMRELKSIFDPDDLLNPDVMFVPPSHSFSRDRWPQRPNL